jgi:D-alanyl-D-alanine carboxypeptidase/D-alanyl-D-alanine-endopeptidase (penicillin-binding protein 4)
VIVDSSLFTGPVTAQGWDPDDLTSGQTARITALMTDGGRTNPAKNNSRAGKPDVAAGQALAKQLGLPNSAVVQGQAPAGSGASATAVPGGAVSPGQLLGIVYSPPMVRLVEMMLSASDNTMADMLARQVALATGAQPSFAGAAEAVLKKLADLGVPTGGASLVDGSGLSNLDRLTAGLLTGLLVVVSGTGHPELHGVLTGLPVAGYSGTLASRYHDPSAAPGVGDVRAKTGTLTGVSSLAGLVVNASGRLLAFAVVADGVPTGGAPAAEAALDRIAVVLAQLH